LDESNSIFAPKFNIESYTVSFKDGSMSEYTEDMLSLAPEQTQTSSSLVPPWVKGGANATLLLEHMSKPRHGTLQVSLGNWYFHPGKSAEGILRPDLHANCQHLLDTGQFFHGHAKFKNVHDSCSQISLQDCVLCHVSAHGLKLLVVPTTLKHHHFLDPEDKAIWDAAYEKGYDGLESLLTREVITEEQYKQLSKGQRALPTMAIATLKYDRNNHLKRAKYWLAVLGNLDYHTWSKEETAAPVMSRLELCLLTSLAVYHKHVLKNCDTRSKLGQYWCLLHSLYGLKRAP
jgi:hypothetical protein